MGHPDASAPTTSVAALAAPIEAACKARGLHLKADKCKYVTRYADDEEKAEISRHLGVAWGPAAHFEVCRSAVYLGFELGPSAGPKQWSAVVAKFTQRVAAIAACASLAAALPGILSSRVASLWRYLGALIDPPEQLGRWERDAWSRVLKLPGSAVPISGFQELSAEWGWPKLSDLALGIRRATHAAATRRGGSWRAYAAALRGVPDDRLPLARLANDALFDPRWGTPPMVERLARVAEAPPAPDPPRIWVAEAVRRRMELVLPIGSPLTRVSCVVCRRRFTPSGPNGL